MPSRYRWPASRSSPTSGIFRRLRIPMPCSMRFAPNDEAVDRPRGASRAASGFEAKGHGGVRLDHPEAEALLDVEPDDVGVVIEIADGEVLPTIELEVTAAQAEHDATLDAGCPHQGSAEDLAQMIEKEMAAILGALDDHGVDVWAEGQSVWAVDP